MMNPRNIRARIAAIVLFALVTMIDEAAQGVTIPTVPVGNPTNAPDQLWPTDNPTNLLFGSVAEHYRIATTEVTNAQYAEFLNAKAASDPLALYNTNMGGRCARRNHAERRQRQLHLLHQAQHGRQANQLCELVRCDPLRQLAEHRAGAW